MVKKQTNKKPVIGGLSIFPHWRVQQFRFFCFLLLIYNLKLLYFKLYVSLYHLQGSQNTQPFKKCNIFKNVILFSLCTIPISSSLHDKNRIWKYDTQDSSKYMVADLILYNYSTSSSSIDFHYSMTQLHFHTSVWNYYLTFFLSMKMFRRHTTVIE